jgi:hypothetical protein
VTKQFHNLFYFYIILFFTRHLYKAVTARRSDLLKGRCVTGMEISLVHILVSPHTSTYTQLIHATKDFGFSDFYRTPRTPRTPTTPSNITINNFFTETHSFIYVARPSTTAPQQIFIHLLRVGVNKTVEFDLFAF